MRHCACPAYWDWVDHAWCPVVGVTFDDTEPEETFDVERHREIGDRFADDVCTEEE